MFHQTCAPRAILLLALLFYVEAFQPEFTEPIMNLSVVVGQDANFKCFVQHLGGYRIGWVKADTKAIQAIHDYVVTHNPRVSVSHVGHTIWNLHIHNIQPDDQGTYMCQINTDPMKSQQGYLNVVTPPRIINDKISDLVSVTEGDNIQLTCQAKGAPTPEIKWYRELFTELCLYEGETFELFKVTKSDTGTYICNASNGIPPSASKKITLIVNFQPKIKPSSQFVGAPFGTDVLLDCYIQASPIPINYWLRGETGEMIVASMKYNVYTMNITPFEIRMSLFIRNLNEYDVGLYVCVVKNAFGETRSTIRLYDIPATAHLTPPEFDDENLLENQIGSAESEILNPELIRSTTEEIPSLSTYQEMNGSITLNSFQLSSTSKNNWKCNYLFIIQILFTFVIKRCT